MANKNNFNVVKGGKNPIPPSKNRGKYPHANAGNFNTVDPNKDPQMTVNVVNEELEAAIEAHKTSRSVADLNRILDLLQTARVLVAAKPNEKGQPVPLLLTSSDGDPVFAVYTSKGHLVSTPQPAIMNMPFTMANTLAANPEAKLKGIVINPFSQNVFLNSQIVAAFEGREKARREGKEIPDAPLLQEVRKPTLNNDELEALLAAYSSSKDPKDLSKALESLHKANLLLPVVLKDGKPVPIFGVLKDTQESIVPVHTSAKSIKPEESRQLMITAPFLTVCKIALSNDKIAGVLCNHPAGVLRLKRELLQTAVQIEENRKKIEEAKKNGTPIRQTIQLKEDQIPSFEMLKFGINYLPQKFFADGKSVVEGLCSRREEYLDELFEDSYENKRMYPYLPEDFSLMAIKLEDGTDVIRIDYPERDLMVGCCERSYLIWQESTGKSCYFGITREKDKQLRIRQFTADKKQIHHGTAPTEGTELQVIIDLARDNMAD